MLSTRPEENHFSTDGVGLQSSEPNAQQLPPGDYDRTKRDSGYGTDFSPASVTSISRRFTFESELDETDCELDVVYEFENMDIRNEVFAEGDGENDTSESDIFEQEISEYSTSVSSERAVRTYETSEQNESDENSEQGVENRLVAGHVSRRRVISEQNVGEHGINDLDNSRVAEHDTSDIGINGYDIVPNDTSVHAIDIRVFDGHAVSGHDTDDTDEADKEVEELLSGSGELGQSDITSQPLHSNLCRPAAPVPTPEDFQEETENVNCDIPNCTNNEVTDLAISHSFHHMPWNRSRRKYYFRPISRSVGTQTPNPNCQIIREAIGILHEPSYQYYGFARGTAANRLRSRSECEESGIAGQLPDLVPAEPDRPHSLPDLVTLRQQYHREMGRELRRIGDEFNSSLERRRSSSNPLAGYWNTIRRFLSPNSDEDR